jgi:DNA processing protein
VARLLADDLAREGIVLVSGLARGIDATAHEAALRRKVPTVAVMASGLDRTYPPEHGHLRAQVEKGGAVLTEFFLGDPPRRTHFPGRNRIISGLSRGVLLIEAGEKSGAGITVRHAVEQAREVFAVPGPIDSPLSIRPNRLIAQGAKLVATSSDVLEELIPGYQPRPGRSSAEEVVFSLSPPARRLLNEFVVDRPVAVEELARRRGGALPEGLRRLTELEMKGVVARQADARYVKLTRS